MQHIRHENMQNQKLKIRDEYACEKQHLFINGIETKLLIEPQWNDYVYD